MHTSALSVLCTRADTQFPTQLLHLATDSEFDKVFCIVNEIIYIHCWWRVLLQTGGRLNIKMSSYQYRDSHVKDKTVSPTVLSLTWKSPYVNKTVFILRRGPDPYNWHHNSPSRVYQVWILQRAGLATTFLSEMAISRSTSNGSWCIGIKCEMSDTVCVILPWNIYTYIWVRSRDCGCLVTWFCYQLIAKPGNKTATVSWLYPYT